MQWTKVKITTTHEGVEPITGLMLNLGINGLQIEDSNDFNEFLKTSSPSWDYVDESLDYLKSCDTTVTLYLPENAQGGEMFTFLRDELLRLRSEDKNGELGKLSVEAENVNEEDWANNWKKYFKPTPVGERLMIKPIWEEIPDNALNGRRILEIDPSASFGTGTHDTTRLCLTLLERVISGGETVLDMGCGSGILGIAAMLLGAKSVTAVDIDENSVRIARENFMVNKIDEKSLTFICSNAVSDGELRETLPIREYSVVVANIVADVIIAILPLLKATRAKGGSILLSGIIEERLEDVKAAVGEENLEISDILTSGGWVALLVK